MASGEPVFAPPTSSSVVPCPSAAGPTFIAIVEGASRPSAKPFVPPRDASGSTFPPIKKVRGSVARCAVANRIRDVAIDVVGTLPRDVVIPLRGAPSGQESERRSVRRRGGIPASRTVRSARGWPRADVPPGQRAKGSVARCAVARIRDVAVDVVGTHPRDVVVPRRVASVGLKAEESIRSRGGAGTVRREAGRV